ncbi:uncharacterized protein LAESUDRAFT_127713 [Laetiporus sulphureus 93-53]|uniref:Uncharacterized protein n=1 Tax=Laetiporus sulphureus 93-53 TaxID=1314785 RepID=A0A165EGI3_9APHY|nr:uncharacterized protein LAESUDRAFT_127713 [Laetiporus sulphureus 93-53]KZT07008.1 hypothetical protein LAESUDRAFT_127713 [Laetiporus sulphureus 93-53]
MWRRVNRTAWETTSVVWEERFRLGERVVCASTQGAVLGVWTASVRGPGNCGQAPDSLADDPGLPSAFRPKLSSVQRLRSCLTREARLHHHYMLRKQGVGRVGKECTTQHW